MFETVRNNAKIMMGVLVVLIIPSFVLVGIEGYTRFNEQGAAVAEIDGEKITRLEWDAAHQREIESIRVQMPGLDPKLLDAPDARLATLERMLNDRVVGAAAADLRLFTSDARLARQLQQDPTIAGLRAADGRLDMERYRQLVAAQGLTPEQFEANVRADLSQRQVLLGVQETALASRSQTDMALNAFYQRREVQLHLLKADDFASQVKVTEEALAQYHQTHAERFRSAENADIDYVVLDVAAVEKTLELPEAELKAYYAQNLQQLASQEQRRASHVLINAPASAPAQERQQARDKAQSLLEGLRKSPSNFAAVAREHSQDPGSASRGGDLDFFARGAMVKPFEDAVFKLQKGQISDLVETEFGFHIILLTDVKAPVTESFEAMRPRLLADLRRQQAQRKVAELAETFTNTVYEQPDSLQPAAEKLGLKVQRAQGVTRQPAVGAVGPLTHPKLLEALFSADVVSKGRNTEAVEIAPSTLVAARIVTHRPAAVRPLAEVRDEVRAQFVRDEASRLATARGTQDLAAWQAQADLARLGPALVVSREQPQGLPAPALDAALRADPAKLPTFVGVPLPGQGYAIVRIHKLLPREAQSPEQLRESRAQFARLWGQAQTQAYLQALRQRYDAKILPSASRQRNTESDN